MPITDRSWKHRTWSLLIPIVLLSLAGCTKPLSGPDLGQLYDRAAQHHDAQRNPVIVIPGILGSRLIDGDTQQVVWGAFGGGAAKPDHAAGARVVALPMQEGATLGELRDSVVPDGVLDSAQLKLLVLPIELNAYANILAILGVGGYRDELLGESGAVDYGDDHYTCFQFDYDWRRDNIENARRLEQFIEEKRAIVQAQYEERYGVPHAEIKFDIVAHSMGGLVTRYFLRYGGADLPADGSPPQLTWAGSRHVDKVIIIGTPNAGSANALMQLVKGKRFAPFLPNYPPAVLGTMPATYQLLPRGRHGPLVDRKDPQRRYDDLLDDDLWQGLGWGLAAKDQDKVLRWLLPEVADPEQRRQIALDHLRKCLRRAARFAEALDAPAEAPPGLEYYLFAGDAVPTAHQVAVDAKNGRVRVIRYAEGDGTVTRASALMDERMGQEWRPRVQTPIDWAQTTFLFTDHLGLTMDPAFSDNVLYLLLEKP